MSQKKKVIIVSVIIVLLGIIFLSDDGSEIKITDETIEIVKEGLEERFFSHMKYQIDFDCFAENLRKKLTDEQFYALSILCKQALNPLTPISENEKKILEEHKSVLDNQALFFTESLGCAIF